MPVLHLQKGQFWKCRGGGKCEIKNSGPNVFDVLYFNDNGGVGCFYAVTPMGKNRDVCSGQFPDGSMGPHFFDLLEPWVEPAESEPVKPGTANIAPVCVDDPLDSLIATVQGKPTPAVEILVSAALKKASQVSQEKFYPLPEPELEPEPQDILGYGPSCEARKILVLRAVQMRRSGNLVQEMQCSDGLSAVGGNNLKLAWICHRKRNYSNSDYADNTPIFGVEKVTEFQMNMNLNLLSPLDREKQILNTAYLAHLGTSGNFITAWAWMGLGLDSQHPVLQIRALAEGSWYNRA